MIRIITDSAADMEKAELEKYSVTSVPLSVSFGENTYLDGVNPVSYTHLSSIMFVRSIQAISIPWLWLNPCI